MKIAVYHNLPFGGAKRALYGFVRYLHSAGNQIDVFVPDTADKSHCLLKEFANKVSVFSTSGNLAKSVWAAISHLSPLYLFSRSLKMLDVMDKVNKSIASVINRGAYDVVFVEQDQFIYSPFLLKYLEKPSVYYCQQPWRTYLREAIFKRLAKNQNMRYSRLNLLQKLRESVQQKIMNIESQNATFATVVLTNSYFTREFILRTYGINAVVSYLGVDETLFRPLDLQRENFVLSVGGISITKGFDFIISSLSKIDEGIRPKLVIIANGEDRHTRRVLEDLAIQKKVRLEIKISVSDEELVLYYNRAKVFVYASWLEPFGLAVIEAMACGTPIVAVKEGGVRESVVDGETGILTDRDETSFSEAVKKLFLDDNLRQTMGQKGRSLVCDKWTLEKAGYRLYHWLRRAMVKNL